MTERAGPTVAVGAVARRDTSLLLVRRGHGPAAGMWSVPGGRVELGETLHEAVVREVAEETGLAVVVDRFLGWVERIGEGVGGVQEHFVILDFAVTVLDPDAEPSAGDDAAEVAWIPVDELADSRLTPGLLDFLEDVDALTSAPSSRSIASTTVGTDSHGRGWSGAANPSARG